MIQSGIAQGVTVVCIIYLFILLVIALYSRTKIHSIEDFLVAGRSLSFPLSTSTLFATWFGAGTLLTVSDEIRNVGVSAALLDPFGAGICLILAGVFFAKPLWEAKLLTLSDLFSRRFGQKVEVLSALVMVPTYFGWIAVQYIALAELLHLFTGLDLMLGIVLVAVIGTGYTLMGGLWSVTLTDVVQVVLLLIGLVVILIGILGELGQGDLIAGVARLGSETKPEKLQLFPYGTAQEFVDALALLTIGAIGNIPGQDLCQRIFAAKSSKVAVRASITAGGMYLLAGFMPVLMGLAADILLDASITSAVVPALVKTFFNGPFIYIFVVVILSVVLSTIDSATLSPASVMAQNLFLVFWKDRVPALLMNQLCIVGVGAVSLATAFIGENAYTLLEEAYAMQLVGLFAPLVISVYAKAWHGEAMYRAMLATIVFWFTHWALDWGYVLEPILFARFGIPIPLSLAATMLCFAAYFLFSKYNPAPASP